MDYRAYYESPLGRIMMLSDGENLTGLWFDGGRHAPEDTAAYSDGDRLAVIADTRRWLNTYFAGRAPDFTPAIKVIATPFRQLTAEIMLQIPYGQTISYGEIARKIARKLKKPRMSAQAVGGAVGHNPISIIIPCHRVIGTDGSMTGYGGGMERKTFLLGLEGIECKSDCQEHKAAQKNSRKKNKRQ